MKGLAFHLDKTARMEYKIDRIRPHKQSDCLPHPYKALPMENSWPWPTLFKEARRITQEAHSQKDGLEHIVAYARANPVFFHDRFLFSVEEQAQYWDKVKAQDFSSDFNTMSAWAKEGLDALDTPKNDWEFLLLDLGDCPETFRLYSPGNQELVCEHKLQKLMASEYDIGCGELQACLDSKGTSPTNDLFGDDLHELTDHHTRELKSPILDWAGDNNSSFYSNNGYFLWLTLGTLAYINPLKNKEYLRSVLRGRKRLHLLAGFEELFTHIATVTPDGISYPQG